MDAVVPRLNVTAADDLSAVPSDVDHLFVLDPDAELDDVDGLDGVTVHDTPDDFEAYATYRDVADDIRYTLKSGATVLVCRRPDAAVVVGVVGKVRARPFHYALEAVEQSHDLDRRPSGVLRDHAMEYVHD